MEKAWERTLPACKAFGDDYCRMREAGRQDDCAPCLLQTIVFYLLTLQLMTFWNPDWLPFPKSHIDLDDLAGLDLFWLVFGDYDDPDV